LQNFIYIEYKKFNFSNFQGKKGHTELIIRASFDDKELLGRGPGNVAIKI